MKSNRPELDRRPLAALSVAVLSVLASGRALAADRTLDQVSAEAGSIVVQFSCPMSFVSNFPQRTGDELRIELQPLPGCAPLSGFGETLPVAADNPAGLLDIRLEQSLGARRSLTLHFARTVEFLIRPKPGLTGIEVVISRRAGRVTVEGTDTASPKPSRSATRDLPPSGDDLDKLLGDARTAMQDRDYDTAIRLYTRLLEYPENAARPQAQEFLGLARERKGQLAQAKKEYEEYLHRYPDGADADAVQQRLAAIVTLNGATRPTKGALDGSRWQIDGAVSQEYRHDKNDVLSNGVTANGVGQTALDSEADLQVRRRGDRYDFKSRVFVGYVKDMLSGAGAAPNIIRLPQAFVEIDDHHSNWVARLGRQSQTNGGVYGSYDGAYFAWQPKPDIRVSAAAGATLQSYDASLQHDRTFEDVSVEWMGVVPGLDITGFAFEQKAAGILDARQVGLESRYYRNGKSLMAQVDYDVSFKALNSVTLMGSISLPRRWVVTGVMDHRHTPFLGAYNALIGQPTTSLETLVQTIGIDGVRQFALDRTAIADMGTLGVQHPLTEQLQWGADISFSRVGSTVASGGVAATPASGSAVGISTQLLGGSWLMDGDVDTVGLGYTTRQGTRAISIFSTARYPLTDKIRIGPRLQVSHTSGNDPLTGTSSGWSASPALLADWRFRRGVVQFEAGYEQAALNASLSPGVPLDPNLPSSTLLSQTTKRFWFGLGYNISF